MPRESEPNDERQDANCRTELEHQPSKGERLELACRSAGVGRWDWNVVADDMLMDEQLLELLGAAPDGSGRTLQSFLRLVHEDDVDHVAAAIQESVDSGADFGSHFRVVWPSGEVHHIQAKGQVYGDSQANPSRLTGVCWEVTAQTRADGLQARLAAIVQGSEDAIISLDRQDRIVTWNDSAERMFQCFRHEAIGMPVGQIVPKDRRNEFEERLEQLRRKSSVSPMESVHIGNDRVAIDVAITMSPIIDSVGSVTGTSVIARDVTFRVQTERELSDSLEKLKQTNKELQQFAYVASHDLHEPLRTVRSFCDLLRKKYSGVIDKQASDWIDFMSDATIRMQQLIDGLLEYSKLDIKTRSHTDIDFGKAVNDAIHNLQAAIDESSAVIEYGDLPVVKADESQIIQLFQNLIGNAIKYSDEPPRVKISCARLEQSWQFSVADNGIGIEPRFHGKVFEMFQRLHARDAYVGTGIGLSFCQKIVNRHGGRIWIESPAKGTIVHFTMPDQG